jgi:ACS family allantoate permease-like MFS transporter
MAVLRLAENETGIDNKKFKMYQLREAFTDLKCWLIILIMLANCIPNVFANSLSIIFKY